MTDTEQLAALQPCQGRQFHPLDPSAPKCGECFGCRTAARLRELEAELERTKPVAARSLSVGAANEQMQRRIAELEGALHKYGIHLAYCRMPGWMVDAHGPDIRNCTCGLREALENA